MRRRKRKHPQIRFVIDHRFHHFIRMQKCEADPGLRISRIELLRVIPHVLQPDRIDHRNAHNSAKLFALPGDFRFHFLVLIQQRFARFEKPPAFRRHHERTLCAIDQSRAEFLFQLPDRLAGRGLRDMLGRRSQRKTAGPNHFTIERQGVEVHECRPILY